MEVERARDLMTNVFIEIDRLAVKLPKHVESPPTPDLTLRRGLVASSPNLLITIHTITINNSIITISITTTITNTITIAITIIMFSTDYSSRSRRARRLDGADLARKGWVIFLKRIVMMGMLLLKLLSVNVEFKR